MNSLDVVKGQLVYWAQVSAAGAITIQDGMGALTIAGPVASVYTLTMPANFTVPKVRRSVAVSCMGAAATGGQAVYSDGASADNTCVIDTFTGPGVAGDRAFDLRIFRMLVLIGGGVG